VPVTGLRCSCGHAAGDPDEFGDHFRLVFDPPGDTGNDGRAHAELAAGHARAALGLPAGVPLPRHACACGFASEDTAQFDDHLLTAFTPADRVGSDGQRHVPAGPPAPGVRQAAHEP
jgi:hypothetical protein